MSELVSKVLDLMRLDSGEVTLRRDWESVDDLVGRRARAQRRAARSATASSSRCPADLPLVFVDATLVVQVLAQPARQRREVHAGAAHRSRSARRRRTRFVRVTVDDDGPGSAARRPRSGCSTSSSAATTKARSSAWASASPSAARSSRRTAARSSARPRPGRRRAARRSRCRSPRRAHDAGDASDPRRRGRRGDSRRTARAARRRRTIESSRPRRARRAEIEARSHKPDLLLVDLGLPDIDGVEVMRRVRAWSPVPIIVLSARTQEAQKIAALDAGADDYVTKPFSAAELLARVRAGAASQRARRGAGRRCCASVDARSISCGV